MAECSASAAKSFVATLDRDRSLQQDRWTEQGSSAVQTHSFRHSTAQRYPTQEAGFSEFEQGHAWRPAVPAARAGPAPESWTADFERLGLRSTEPQRLQHATAADWSHEFMALRPQDHSVGFREAVPQEAAPMWRPAPFVQGRMEPRRDMWVPAASSSREDSLFEDAFRRVEQLEERGGEKGKGAEHAGAWAHRPTEGSAEQTRPPAGAAEEPAQPSSANADDEVAAIARTLLNNVSHEQDAKFKNSAFFQLVRQLRDGEASIGTDDVLIH